MTSASLPSRARSTADASNLHISAQQNQGHQHHTHPINVPNAITVEGLPPSTASASQHPKISIAEKLLNFWFRDIPKTSTAPEPAQTTTLQAYKRWYMQSPEFDRECIEIGKPLIEALAENRHDERKQFETTADGKLAAIIICDQLTRNCYRGSPEAFKLDRYAQELTLGMIEKGEIDQYSKLWRSFALMPLMHSEELHHQNLSCEHTAQINPEAHKFAQDHHKVIAQFGRFPHRNMVLERDMTQEEEEWLDSPQAPDWTETQQKKSSDRAKQQQH
jgi:uncharacterized protein (DUF924 family)